VHFFFLIVEQNHVQLTHRQSHVIFNRVLPRGQTHITHHIIIVQFFFLIVEQNHVQLTHRQSHVIFNSVLP
jgi:hypothetical protein